MRRSPRKMNFYHNRHRSDGKLIEKEERITTSDLENNYTNTEKNLSNNIIQIPKENKDKDKDKDKEERKIEYKNYEYLANIAGKSNKYFIFLGLLCNN